jgi:hypothetical protein
MGDHLCQGIITTHAADLKPENMLVNREDKVRIADFGVSIITGLEDKTQGLLRAQRGATGGLALQSALLP